MMYNVYAIYFDGREKELIAENKTEENAEAIINLCVLGRGVEECYYTKELAK